MKKFFLSLFFAFASAFAVFAVSPDLEKALNLLNEGKTDEAMAILKVKLQNEPPSPDNYMAMGLAQLDKENYSEAKINFQKALELNKKIVAAHYMLAMIYEKEGDFSSALDKWQRIIKHSKNEALKSLAEKHIKQLKEELK